MATFDDEQALDLAFAGQPFVQIGSANDDTTLDLAFRGQPFTTVGSSTGGTSVATSQAQTAAAAATVSGTATPGHRYWRVYITAVTGFPHLSVTEVEFRVAIGGPDQCTGGTPIYSNQSSGYEASKAFDRTLTTSWYVNQSTYPLPQWIGYDFGASNPKDIAEFALTCWNVNEMPRDFELQWSDDGTTWTKKYSRSAETWTAANQVKAYSSSNGPTSGANKTFWRVRSTAVDNSTVFGLSELRMMSTAGGANLCTGGTPWASSQQEGGGPPDKAFDGVVETSAFQSYWSGNTATEWIGYQFASAVDIVQIQIAARATYQNQAPKDFVVEYWDGTQYVTAWSVTGSSGWASTEVRTFTKPGGAASVAVTTSQAQSASSSAGVASNATVTTAQAQTASATASAISAGAVAVTTSQAQTASASAGTSSSASVATSQAQHSAAMVPLDAVAGTKQGQTSSAAASVRTSATATTSQAQSSSAAVSATTPWTLIRRDLSSYSFEYTTADGFADVMPASVVVAGDHILFAVQYSNGTTVTGVTDTAGNTYTPTLPIALDGDAERFQWFYALNVAGHSANVIRVAYSADMASSSRVLTAMHIRSPGPAVFDVQVRNATNTLSTTISAGPFNTAAAGMIVAGIVSTKYDTESVWINGMQFTAPRSTYFYGTGYRVTSGPQSATSVGVTGSTISAKRILSAVSLVDAPTDPTATTRQGQTTSAVASVSGAANVATAQGQKAQAAATVAASTTISSSQAQGGNAQAQLGLVLAGSTAQAQAVAAQADVAVDTGVTSQQGQSAACQAGVSTDASAELAQAQGASGMLGVESDTSAATSSAQHAAGQLAHAYVVDVATAQAQQLDAQAGVESSTEAATAQAQGVVAEGVVSIDTTAATDQRQRVRSLARAEAVNTVESAQVQQASGTLGLETIAVTATRQGQHSDLQAGVAADSQVQLGQVQHIGDGNVLVVAVDATVATAQDAQHAAGVLEQYQPQPGMLTLAGKRVHAGLAGAVQPRIVLDATIRIRPVLSGRADLRPER